MEQDKPSNFELMSRFLRNVWEKKNEDVIHREFEGIATGLWPDETGIDPDGFLQYFRALSPLVKDLKFHFREWHEQGDQLWLSWMVTGKHWKRSELDIRWPGAASCRFREGKLVECNNYQDFMTLFSQLHLVPEQAFEYGLAGAEIIEEEERRKEALAPSQRGQSHFLWPGLKMVEKDDSALYLPVSSHQLAITDLGQSYLLPDDEQLEVLFESAAFSMVLVDHKDVISRTDESFAELVDRLPESLPGLFFYQLLHPQDQPREQQLFAELMQGTRLQYRHKARLMRGRTVLWVHLAVARIPATEGGTKIVRAVHEASRLEDVVQFQETERKMLSMELHDGLAQDLATLWIHLQTGRHQLQPSAVLVERCLSVVDRMSEEIRRRMKDLRSPILEGEKLSSALQSLVQRLSRELQFPITLDLRGPLDTLSDTVAMLVYRVVQEAVRNAATHSGGTGCTVELERDEHAVRGIVTDDGRGFDLTAASEKGRLGLLGMKERCELVGGKFSVETAPGEGTKVVFELVGEG